MLSGSPGSPVLQPFSVIVPPTHILFDSKEEIVGDGSVPGRDGSNSIAIPLLFVMITPVPPFLDISCMQPPPASSSSQ
jgi:hypothetical protein